jgi:hypothetical protein
MPAISTTKCFGSGPHRRLRLKRSVRFREVCASRSQMDLRFVYALFCECEPCRGLCQRNASLSTQEPGDGEAD